MPETTTTAPTGGALSLLSLSLAAANATPIPILESTVLESALETVAVSAESAVNPSLYGSSGSHSGKHHRRLTSMGRTRRRLSDAQNAAQRPTTASLQANGLSLASLSLASSPPPSVFDPAVAASHLGCVPSTNSVTARDVAQSLPAGVLSSKLSSEPFIPVSATPIVIPKDGKKRGTEHRCETCSKVYRHPSCLIKHRWEHTPHWKESSKYVLSKHQQVQLLEAAAILSHISPASSSLPEDRSLWPAFLCGASLPASSFPAPSTTAPSATCHNSSDIAAVSNSYSTPIASSVPISGSAPASRAPRLHSYSIPTSSESGANMRQVGFGVATTGAAAAEDGDYAKEAENELNNRKSSMPVAVPSRTSVSASWDASRSSGNHYRERSRSSAIRSGSIASSVARSRSGSGSRDSDDEDESIVGEVDVEMYEDSVGVKVESDDLAMEFHPYGRGKYAYAVKETHEDDGLENRGYSKAPNRKKCQEEEEDWEMEMEM